MTVALNLIGAKVTDEQGATHDPIQIVVRSGQASLRSDGHTVTHRTGVARVGRKAGNLLSVEFDNGDVWEVERRRRGCGCGH